MPNIIVCSGNLIESVNTSGRINTGVLACDSGWEIVPYVQPTDTTALYAQLVALNELDPAIVGLIVVGCCVLYTMGFAAGVVIKKMRQA